MTSYANDVIPDGSGKIEVRSCNKLGLFAHEGGICVGADLCVRCNTHTLLCTIGTPEQSQKPLMGVCVCVCSGVPLGARESNFIENEMLKLK